MKKIAKLWMWLLALVGLTGGALLAGETATPFVAEAAPVEATSVIEEVDATDKAFLILKDNIWGSADADYTIHYWGGNTSTNWPGKTFEWSNELNCYYVDDYDNTSTHVIIVRWRSGQIGASGGETNRWDWYDVPNEMTSPYNLFVNTAGDSCSSHVVTSIDTYSVLAEIPNSWATPHLHKWQVFDNAPADETTPDTNWPGVTLNDVDTSLTYSLSDGYRLCEATFSLFGSTVEGITNNLILNNGQGSVETPGISGWSDDPYQVFRVNVNETSATAELLADAKARREAYNFLTYFRSLRKEDGETSDSICWVLKDTEAYTTLMDTWNSLTDKSLVNSLMDGDVMIADTISMLQNRNKAPAASFFAFHAEEENSFSLFLAIGGGVLLLLGGGYFFFRHMRKQKSSL